MNSAYNICLFGASLETTNMGVSALASSLIKLFWDVLPDANIRLMIGHRNSAPQTVYYHGKKKQVDVVNYRLSPTAFFNNHLFWLLFLAVIVRLLPVQKWRRTLIRSNTWLRTLNDAAMVGEIRGGDSFSDIYGVRRFLIGIIPSIIAILLRKKLILLPQTYGPYHSFIARKIARYVLAHATAIYSRDYVGIDIIKQLIPAQTEKIIKFCPDVAFTLEVIHPQEISTLPPFKKEQGEILIGLNVNGLVFNGGYTQNNMFELNFDYRLFISQLITKIFEIENTKIFLIPHAFGAAGTANSDPDACSKIHKEFYDQYGDRIVLLIEKYNQYEIKGIIQLCDFFIGTRMHACIAALSQGIPTVAIAYSRKFIGVFASIGFDDWVVDARKFTMDQAIKRSLTHLQNYQLAGNEIIQKITVAQNTIIENFQKLVTENICS